MFSVATRGASVRLLFLTWICADFKIAVSKTVQISLFAVGEVQKQRLLLGVTFSRGRAVGGEMAWSSTVAGFVGVASDLRALFR